MGGGAEFGLLGTLEVRVEGEVVPLGQPKQRALLAILLLHANRVITRDRLIDELWGDDPPVTAVKSVQTYVSQLRKLLPAGTLVTRPPGYLIEVEPEAVDLQRFERLVVEARSSEPVRASSLLCEALALWRGPPLAEFDGEPFALAEAARLEDAKLVALEERIEADLALGRHAEVVGELETLVGEHPNRERPRGQLMLALYRSGRQAEALDAYRQARAALGELGLEPGAALRQLERQILTQDPSLDLAGGPLRPATRRAPLPGALVPAPPFPFVGRAKELTALRSLLERAEDGEGGFVLLGAEAGGGKTRIVRELAREASARGVLVLYGVSDAVVGTPYQPLREWLEFLPRVLEPEVLETYLGGRRELVARLAPRLAPAHDRTTEVDRHAVQIAVCEVLRRLSLTQAVMLVAEDVHWADAETLQLLRRLAATAPEARMLVLASYRDRGEEPTAALADALAELTRIDGVVRVVLPRITSEDVGAFIRASTDAEAADALVDAIAELTSGTPLLLCELWRDLRERGAVEVSHEGVRLLQPLAELHGPARLRDVVRQRLARLAPETVATLELAAVSGPRFELRVLAHAAGRAHSAATIEEATGHGFLDELPEAVPTCRFTHELVRRAVYDRITALRRAELHLRVGEALEHVHASDPTLVLPELAHHFTLAAAVAGAERAVDYNLRAAGAATVAGAYGEAVATLSTALGLGIADMQERARAQVELAHLLRETGRVAEAETTLAASLGAVSGAGERAHAARVLVHRLHHEMWSPGADPQQTRALAARALETLAELGDSRGLAETERLLAIAARRQGRTAEACKALERAIDHAVACGDQSARRMATTSLAFALCDGPATAGEGMRRCTELLAASRGDRVLEANVTRCLSALLAMARRFDDALDLLRRSEQVLGSMTTTATFVYSRAAAETLKLVGNLEGAEKELTAAWRWFRDLRGGAPDSRATQFAYRLALLQCDEGRWRNAERLLEEAPDAPGGSSYGAEFVLGLAVRARLAAHRGELGEALTLAERAVALAEQTDLLNHRAELWLVLGANRRLAGATAEADAAVAEALRLYEAKGNVAAVAVIQGGAGAT